MKIWRRHTIKGIGESKMKDVALIIGGIWLLCVIGVAIQIIWSIRNAPTIEEYKDEMGI